MLSLRELSGVTPEIFERDIVPAFEPVVLRGLASHWPAVQACRSGFQDAVDYLLQWGDPVLPAIMARPSADRQLGYAPDGKAQNFIKDSRPLSGVLEQIWRYAHFDAPPSVAIQSASLADSLPGFKQANGLDLVPSRVEPRMWLGNQLTVAAHFDSSQNIACVVAGRRRFTLLPQSQIGNLYLGPLEATPAGAPTSMASLVRPDFDRYPKLREALAAARVAELEPGDAIYIPPTWYHQVESLHALNILVNYWWREPLPGERRQEEFSGALWLAALTYRHLPATERKAWGEIFKHFVFEAPADGVDHIPADKRGMLGEITPELARTMRAYVKGVLKDE